MPRINKSQYAILGFLSKRDMSGYDLLNLFNTVSKFYWSEGNAQVYNMLKRFEEEGFVTAKEDKKSGGRRRRVYSITKKGLAHYKKWLNEPTATSVYREEFLLKLAGGQFLSKKALIKHLKDYKMQVEQQIHELGKKQKHIDEDHAGRKDQPYMLMVYDFIELGLRAKLKWVEKHLTKIF